MSPRSGAIAENSVMSPAHVLGGYVPAWVTNRVIPPRENLLTTMTKPIDTSAPFWNILDRLTRIIVPVFAVPMIAWAAWTTRTIYSHSEAIARELEWRHAHTDTIKEKLLIVDRIERETTAWRERMIEFQTSAKSDLRATDQAIRESVARLTVISDTLIRMQEGQSAIREKMVNLQVQLDDVKSK